jgi:nucleotide-binding universal stress UspA family protein
MDDERAPIFVGVDGSKQSIVAARWAAALADRFNVELGIVHALPDAHYFASGLADEDREGALAYLEEATQTILQEAASAVRADFGELPVTTEKVVQVPGESARQTLAELSRHASLFVVGNDEVGPAGALLVGSATLTLAMQSACPIVAWRGDRVAPNDQPILVGVGGDGGPAVLPIAFKFAHQLSVPLIVVHAWSPPHQPGDVIIPFLIDWNEIEAQQYARLAGALAPWRQRYPEVEVTCLIEQTKPSRLLTKHAADAQLVIVGRSHRGIVTGALLGSTNLNLLHHSPVGVMICPPQQEPAT